MFFFILGKWGLQRIIKMRLTSSKVHNLLWWIKLFYWLLFFLTLGWSKISPQPTLCHQKNTYSHVNRPLCQIINDGRILRFADSGRIPNPNLLEHVAVRRIPNPNLKLLWECWIPNPESESYGSSPNLNFESESWNYKKRILRFWYRIPNHKIRRSNLKA